MLHHGIRTCASALIAALAAAAWAIPTPPPAGQRDELGFLVREGYDVSLVADGVRDARFLIARPDGALLVSRPQPGDILLLRDTDGDGAFDSRTTFVDGKKRAHGMCLHGDDLWFATDHAVYRARDTTGDDKADHVDRILEPSDLYDSRREMRGAHWWRSLLVTDDAIYTSVGDAGNINDETNTARQKIWRFDRPEGDGTDAGNRTLFASGIRNTEKLLIRPGTEEIWGLDHGSDYFGLTLGEQRSGFHPITDRFPPDELNLYVEGGFYGHPFIVGDRIPRYEWIERKGREIVRLADRSISPEWEMGAHWACNGFIFIDPEVIARTDALPDDHAGDAFVAAHGSWNSTVKVGYCIARVLFDDQSGRPYGMLPIVSTLGPGDEVLARPVDCALAPDGSILFSCDHTGRIFRIRAADD